MKNKIIISSIIFATILTFSLLLALIPNVIDEFDFDDYFWVDGTLLKTSPTRIDYELTLTKKKDSSIYGTVVAEKNIDYYTNGSWYSKTALFVVHVKASDYKSKDTDFITTGSIYTNWGQSGSLIIKSANLKTRSPIRMAIGFSILAIDCVSYGAYLFILFRRNKFIITNNN